MTSRARAAAIMHVREHVIKLCMYKFYADKFERYFDARALTIKCKGLEQYNK